MGSGSSSSQQQGQVQGTASPVTATLQALFGGAPTVSAGQFVPTGFGGLGSIFTPQSFAGLSGLLGNQPLTGIEQFLLGAQQAPSTQRSIFDENAYRSALSTWAGAGPGVRGGPIAIQDLRKSIGIGGGPTGPAPDPSQFMRTETIPGGAVFGGGIQNLGLANALQSQQLLSTAAEALPGLLNADPTATIAQARKDFSQQTLPAILERAPGFSSSDLQRELTRAGTDLETQIAAAREQARVGVARDVMQGLPGFAQAVGTNLLDQAASVLGFGQLGRDFMREVSPAGDAFRVLSALQGLTGPGLTNVQFGSGKSKSGAAL